eukprot:gene10234-biopygen5549
MRNRCAPGDEVLYTSHYNRSSRAVCAAAIAAFSPAGGVVDTVGAGDTFHAAVIAALMTGPARDRYGVSIDVAAAVRYAWFKKLADLNKIY